jgi:hypothetical protein
MDEISGMKPMFIEKAVLPERFHFSTADPFEGIIAYVTRECGRNVADSEIIGITSSSIWEDDSLAKYAADLTDVKHIFVSKNEANQWTESDFTTAEIEPIHYSIRTHGDSSGTSHL